MTLSDILVGPGFDPAVRVMAGVAFLTFGDAERKLGGSPEGLTPPVGPRFSWLLVGRRPIPGRAEALPYY